MGTENGAAPVENNMVTSQKKLNLELPNDPAISFLGIHPKISSYVWTDICIPTLIAVLFAIAKR